MLACHLLQFSNSLVCITLPRSTAPPLPSVGFGFLGSTRLTEVSPLIESPLPRCRPSPFPLFLSLMINQKKSYELKQCACCATI